jgi:MFS family permease
MLQTFRQIAALLFGITVLTLGMGMLYVLIVVRASEAGFSSQWIGIIQSAYQVGWLVAALIIPSLIHRVGHIRVFAAVAALGSGVILLHLLLIEEMAWAVERIFMGVCTAGLMIVAESWLNDMSDNKGRGKILAIYTIISWGAPVVGMWLLRFGDISSSFFFLLSSIIISVGVLPILLSASRTPSLISVERFNIRKLYEITPVGVAGTFMSGLCHGAFFAVVAIYATSLDLEVREVTNINALAILIGVLVQWPLGMLSDRFDRRNVMIVCAGMTALCAFLFGLHASIDVNTIYLAVACMSAFCLGLYSQCISHANDNLSPGQVVSATGSLVMVYGIGYAITPIVSGFLIAQSPVYFYWVIGSCAALLAFFVMYRKTRKAAIANQGELIAMAAASPYAPVMIAAEEWSDEVELVDNRSEMTRPDDRNG